MREKNRKSIASLRKLPQFTTMNVIDGQAGLIINASLNFYCLTIDNILNIIVLLILAGVAISMLSGDNGIIQKDGNAKNAWNISSSKEETAMSQLLGEIKGVTIQPVQAGECTGTENKKYIDSNGDVAIIPAGFTVSKVAGEDTIEDGLVVYSMDEETAKLVDWTAGTDANSKIIQETYNQYVWIPVENSNEMFGIDKSGNKVGKLYSFNKSSGLATKKNWSEDEKGLVSIITEEKNREPSLVSTCDNDSKYYGKLNFNSSAEFEKALKQEFNDMATSVETYKGFYIGRYELTSQTEVKAVVKNREPVDMCGWYNLYKYAKCAETSNTSVYTGMIWGCQWDQTIKVTLTSVEDFLSNSLGYGVYLETPVLANGVSGRMPSAYNIYDMGGNDAEATLEAYSSTHRVCRGGCNNHRGSSCCASSWIIGGNCCGESLIDLGNNLTSTRVQMYIK